MFQKEWSWDFEMCLRGSLERLRILWDKHYSVEKTLEKLYKSLQYKQQRLLLTLAGWRCWGFTGFLIQVYAGTRLWGKSCKKNSRIWSTFNSWSRINLHLKRETWYAPWIAEVWLAAVDLWWLKENLIQL